MTELRKTGTILFFLFIALPWSGKGSTADYSVGIIAPELLKDANAVVRLHETVYEFKGPGQMKISNKLVVTILKESGASHSMYKGVYDRFTTINKVEGIRFNADGKMVEVKRNKAVYDVTYNSSSTFAGDIRIKLIDMSSTAYPYTVEFTEERTVNGFISALPWFAFQDYHASLESASLKVIHPPGLTLNLDAFNLPASVPIVEAGTGKQVLNWAAGPMPAIHEEPFSPDLILKLPVVFVSPAQIEISGYKGSLASWSDFASFITALNEGKDRFEKSKDFDFDSCYRGVTDKKKVVENLYRYLQNNTRYVSVQLGIGGWQSFDADYVHKYKIGDCKALATYMKAMLKRAGIESYLVLVNAGDEKEVLMPGFAYNIFNHMVLCIPMEKDSVWLECTSGYAPYGYMGSFTEGHPALILKEQGSELIRIPEMAADSNVLSVETQVKFSNDGNIEALVTMESHYEQQEQLRYYMTNHKTEEVRKWIKARLKKEIKKIDSLEIRSQENNNPFISLSFQMDASGFFTRAGNGYIFSLNPFATGSRVPEKADERKAALYNDDAVKIRMKTSYQLLPEMNFSMPQREPLLMQSEFGDYRKTAVYSPESKRLVVYSEFTLKAFHLPSNRYNELREFLLAVSESERETVFMARK